MYELKSRIRYSETDTDAKLSLTGIMNYMQDCSTMQSEDMGVGIEYLSRAGKAWLLSSWQIVIERRPLLGEPIRVVTWPHGVKGLYALRNFALLDEKGEYLVKANSYWFLMNTETGRPMRIEEADTAPYGAFAPKIEMEDSGRKISMPTELKESGRLTVMKHLLDTNLHVNNAQYVDIARELLPAGTEIAEIRAEYRKAAVLGDEIVVKSAREGTSYLVSLCSTDGTVFANVELKEKTEQNGEAKE